MVPILGRTLILLALLAASAGSIVGFATGARPNAAGWKWARRLAYAFAAFMALANLTMEYALLTHDFSVSYVAHVGSRAVPTWVSIVSLWSSLEGSILFWGLVMGVYVAVATWRKADEHPEYMPYAVGVWLACGAFFSFLLAGPAQPFATVLNPVMDGPGPNPLLQNHYLMVIHPPCLYTGYVGMTIPFGLACAALLVGRLGNDFIRPLRNFLLFSWIFLTCAIVLGGWWAYEVLGWGGYWAWDPVENASFLPWLTATAALHSALLVERKGVLKGWTTILVLATYLLTILGTFMTRSGVFNSVHSFTQSAIGPTILVFLAVALLFALVLLALRVDSLGTEGHLETGPSRDVMFLVQNLLFVLFTFTVLLGTVFPLIVEAVRGVQMSVGRPYFDRMSVPIGVALLFVMGVGPALPWGRATAQQMRSALLPPLLSALLLAVAGLLLGVRNAWTPRSRPATASSKALRSGGRSALRICCAVARPQGSAGPTPMTKSKATPMGTDIRSKYGRPTLICTPRTASTMRGNTVPSSTVKVKRTKSRFWTRNITSRDGPVSRCPSVPRLSTRSASRTSENSSAAAKKTRMVGPMALWVKECTELKTPERVMKVPRIVSR